MGNICTTSNLCKHSNINIHTITSVHPVDLPGFNNLQNFQLMHSGLNNNHANATSDIHYDSWPSPDKQSAIKFIDSYNPKNNFFYYLKHILVLQRSYKRYYNRKKAMINAKAKANEDINVNVNVNACVKEECNNNNNNKFNEDVEDEPSLIQNIHISRFSFISRAQSLKSNKGIIIKGNFLLKKNSHHYKYIGYANAPKGSSNKQKQGRGKIIWDDHSYLTGLFDKNVLNSFATFYDSSSGGIFTGEYRNNVPDGYGIYKQDGCAQEGYWKSNLLNDIGVEYSEDDTYYQGEISNCVKEGVGLFRWSDGTVYKGEFQDNAMMGYGIIVYPDGRMFLGEVLNGLMHGYGEFYWGDSGKRYFGFYEEDKRHGFGCYIWELEPFHAFMGFWEGGKMNGVGVTIKGSLFKYGLWKDGSKAIWLEGPWEMLKYVKQEQLQYVKFLMQNQKNLLEYIKKSIQ